MSTKYELQRVIEAKEKGLPVSCGVTPHHLFLTEDDTKGLGPYGMMKPVLKPKKDVEFLWEHLSAVDLIESDHAPHTKIEKESSPTPFGVPGLETTLPLLLTAVHEKRLALDDIIRLCYEGPRKLLSLPEDKKTYTEIDPRYSYEIRNENLQSKCKWTPFNGWKMQGKVVKVILHGDVAFENDSLKVSAGSGTILPS